MLYDLCGLVLFMFWRLVISVVLGGLVYFVIWRASVDMI